MPATATPTTAPTEIEYRADPVAGSPARRAAPVRSNYQPISKPAYQAPPPPSGSAIPVPPPPARVTPPPRAATRSPSRASSFEAVVVASNPNLALSTPIASEAAFAVGRGIATIPEVDAAITSLFFEDPKPTPGWNANETERFERTRDKTKDLLKDATDLINDTVEFIGRDIENSWDTVKFVWDSNKDWLRDKMDDYQIPQIDRPPVPEWELPRPRWRIPPVRLPKIGNPIPRFDLPPLKNPFRQPYTPPNPQPEPFDTFQPGREPGPSIPRNPDCYRWGYSFFYASGSQRRLDQFTVETAPGLHPEIESQLHPFNQPNYTSSMYLYGSPLANGDNTWQVPFNTNLGGMGFQGYRAIAGNGSLWETTIYRADLNVWKPYEVERILKAYGVPGATFLHAFGQCLPGGNLPKPRPHNRRPPRKPRRRPPDMCNCDDQRAINNANLVQIQVPTVSCTLYQSDENPNGVWVPEINYIQIEIAKGSASAYALAMQALADSAIESCEAKNAPGMEEIAQRLGIDQFPVSLPRSLKAVPGGAVQQDINSFPEMWLWWIRQFDAIAGQFPLEIKIKDSDPLKAGDQPIELSVPNVAEALSELFGLALSAEINSQTTLNVGFRTLTEAGMAKNAAIVGQDVSRAIAEFLGFKSNPKMIEVPTAFTPGKTKLSEALKESVQKIRSFENADDEDLRDMVMPLLEAAAIIRAVHWRKLDGKSDFKDQIKGILQSYIDLAEGSPGAAAPDDPEKPKRDSWDKFLDDTERGFIDRAGIRDQAQPYGRSYDQRPLIRELGDTGDVGAD